MDVKVIRTVQITMNEDEAKDIHEALRAFPGLMSDATIDFMEALRLLEGDQHNR